MLTTPFDKPLRALTAPQAEAPQKIALRKACKDFESFFIKEMIASAKSEKSEGLFGSDSSSDIINNMTRDALTTSIQQGGGIGIWQPMYLQLEKTLTEAPTDAMLHNPESIPGNEL